MSRYTVDFPLPKLDTTIASLRKFDFYARAHMATDVLGPELAAAVAARAPTGEKYIYPSTTPEQTDVLRKSFYPTTVTLPMGVELFIRSRAKHARFVLDGTPAHSISASKRRFLSFYFKAKGGWAFPKTVNHPGTRANHYTEGARALMQERAVAEMRVVMRDFPR